MRKASWWSVNRASAVPPATGASTGAWPRSMVNSGATFCIRVGAAPEVAPSPPGASNRLPTTSFSGLRARACPGDIPAPNLSRGHNPPLSTRGQDTPIAVRPSARSVNGGSMASRRRPKADATLRFAERRSVTPGSSAPGSLRGGTARLLPLAAAVWGRLEWGRRRRTHGHHPLADLRRGGGW